MESRLIWRTRCFMGNTGQELPFYSKTNCPTQGKTPDLKPDSPTSIHRFPHKALQILKTGPVNNAYSHARQLTEGRLLNRCSSFFLLSKNMSLQQTQIDL
jgi:hypothetical protein